MPNPIQKGLTVPRGIVRPGSAAQEIENGHESIKRVLYWGTAAFFTQTAISIVLPRYIIQTAGASVYGQLSLFALLLLPSLWFDFSANLNTGLIGKLQSVDEKELVFKIRVWGACDPLFWSLICVGLIIGGNAMGQVVFSASDFFLLVLLSVLLPYSFRIVWYQFGIKRFTYWYRFQIFVSLGWGGAVLIFAQQFPIARSILYACLSVLVFLVFWNRFRLGKIEEHGFDIKRRIDRLGQGFKRQILYFIQSVVQVAALQVDRFIIADMLQWKDVAYYVIPIGLLFKFPAFIGHFLKPLLSQIAAWRHKKSYVAVQSSFQWVTLGGFYLAVVVLIPFSVYFIPVVGLWINPVFAAEAFPIARVIIWFLPFAILMMLTQPYLVAYGKGRQYNIAAVGICFLHWGLLYLGAKRIGVDGISWGFGADALGGLVLTTLSACLVLDRQERYRFFLKLMLGLIFWGSCIGLTAFYGVSHTWDVTRILPPLLFQTCFGLIGCLLILRRQGRFSHVDGER